MPPSFSMRVDTSYNDAQCRTTISNRDHMSRNTAAPGIFQNAAAPSLSPAPFRGARPRPTPKPSTSIGSRVCWRSISIRAAGSFVRGLPAGDSVRSMVVRCPLAGRSPGALAVSRRTSVRSGKTFEIAPRLVVRPPCVCAGLLRTTVGSSSSIGTFCRVFIARVNRLCRCLAC